MTDTTCQVCDTTYNKRANKAIACQHCAQTACAQCWEQYFMSDNPIIFRPRCMMPDCRREFISDFLRANFTNHFLTHKLRERQAGILSDISANYMPQTQQVVGIQDIVDTKHIKIREYREEIANISLKINELYAEINTYRDTISGITNNNGKKSIEYTFTQKCPVDDCAGYLSNVSDANISKTIKYCSLCKKHTCIDCNATVTIDTPDEHTCDPDARRTLAEIKKHAKPCPKCGVYISKTDGCNDMFCSLCNTAFRYDTGIIQTRNSNPLYADYVRRMGTGAVAPAATATVAATNQCCMEIAHEHANVIKTRLTQMIKIRVTDANKKRVDYISNAISHTINLVYHCDTRRREVFRFHERLESLYNTPEAYNLRLSLLYKQINDTYYNSELYRMCKTNDKNRDISNILDMYSQSLRDILIEFYQYIMGLPIVSDSFQLVLQWGFYNKITILTDYTNNCFKQTAKNYGSGLKCWVFLKLLHKFSNDEQSYYARLRQTSRTYNSSGMYKHTAIKQLSESDTSVYALHFHPTLCEGTSAITHTFEDISKHRQTSSDIVKLTAFGEYVFDNIPIAMA